MLKKIVSWALVIAMTAAIAVGGTMAYLTDTDEDVNVMTLGNVKIDQLEYERIDTETKDEDAVVQEFHDNKPLYPAVTEDGFNWEEDSTVDWTQIGKDGYTSNIWDPDRINNELDKMVFVKNKGTYDAYVRSVFAFEANGYSLDEFKALFHLNINEEDWTWEWEETPVSIPGDTGATNYIIVTATYNKVLKPGQLTEISLSQIALDPSAGNADILGFGDTYQVLVKTQAMQAEGFNDPKAALDEGFGDVSTVPGEIEIPFESDSPIKGIDLRTALHNLNGDTTQSITSKVKNVIFGLNSEYPAIVDGYEGTLVDVEQDVPVYAYYVPNGNGYDVYFLANGVVFTPSDSHRLFYNMTALETVDTHNMDVSRTKSMEDMFYKCKVLKSMDTSHWDTASATTMYGMFSDCYELTELDVSGFKTGNCTSTSYMFYKCGKLTQLDVAGFDTGKVTSFASMFSNCTSLKEVDVTNWNTSNVKATKAMFSKCYKLEQVTGMENLVSSNCTTSTAMFNYCKSLKRADVSGWDPCNVTDMSGIFNECNVLEEIVGAGNWNTDNLTNMDSSFANCYNLRSLEGTENWNVENVTLMCGTFKGCHSLKELDVSTWDTGKVTTFRSMFSANSSNTGAMQVDILDVSDWDTSSCTEMSWMFYGCGQITELDLSNWDVSNVTTMHHMFTDCLKMENYNFSGWNTTKLQTIDGIFNSNLALKSVDVSDFDTENITDFDQVFDGCTKLEEIIGLDQWDTSNGQSFCEFLLGTNVKEIDLSSFDMSSALYTQNMFHVNSRLTTIYVGDNWNLNPEQLKDGGMFGSSPALTGANGSTVASLKSNSAVYACVDTPEIPGLLTHISQKPAS